MEKEEDALRVRLLGGFEMSYRGRVISTAEKETTRPLQVLQRLLYAGADGISRKELIKDIFGDETEINTTSNLGVTVWQLRKFLRGCGLPEENYIAVSDGIYRFASSFPVALDTDDLERVYRKAEQETDTDALLALLREVCRLYRGHFLPDLVGSEWVEVAGVHYKKIYYKSLDKLCDLLHERAENEEILELCGKAAKLFPYDEWETWQIEALMELGRFQEALEVYEETTSRYRDELGIRPSGRMQGYFRRISDNLASRTEDIREVLEKQHESETEGAYYCAYPGFVDVYHVLERMVIRSGQSVYVMLCTIVDEEESGGVSGNRERQKKLAEKLEDVIVKTLRRGDVYTKYSQNQFMLLLVVQCQDDLSKIISRLDNGFHRKVSSRRVRISYRTTTLSIRQE